MPTALISGGRGDLATAIASHLLEQGWLVHQPSREEMDVTNPSSIDAFVSSQLDSIDLLINNAGQLEDSLFGKIREEQWDAVMDTHLKGAWRLTRAVLPKMLRARSGHFLQISSFSAFVPPRGQTNYASAKAAIIAFTQSLALEYGPKNLRANCILPGFLETKMTQHLQGDQLEAIRNRHALRRFNTPEDVARFVQVLHSLNHVSGQVFQLDSRIRAWN